MTRPIVVSIAVVFALLLLVVIVGCGESDDSDSDDAEGDATCSAACNQVEAVCPDVWDSVDECVEACESEPFSQQSLDCVVDADDCDEVDSCSD